MTLPENVQNETDAAIAGRLGRLRSLPMDTTGLDQMLRARLPSAPARAGRRWAMRVSAIAASLLIVVMVLLVFMPGREAQASPDVMAQMHRDIVAGTIPTMQADSIEEANRAIAALSGNFPQLPQPPESHRMACCMRNVAGKKVACVLLNDGATKVTMVVADAADVESPKSPTVVRGGITYHVQTVKELHMVMTERQHRWVCLIGETSVEKLMDLADAIKF